MKNFNTKQIKSLLAKGYSYTEIALELNYKASDLIEFCQANGFYKTSSDHHLADEIVLVSLVEKGLSYREMERSIGVAFSLIAQLCKRYKLDLYKKQFQNQQDLEKLEELLKKRGNLSFARISRATGFSQPKAIRLLEELINSRSNSDIITIAKKIIEVNLSVGQELKQRELYLNSEEFYRELKDLVKEGLSLQQIADNLKSDINTIRKSLEKFGIFFPQKKTYKKAPVAEILRLHAKGLKHSKISRELKVPPSTVHRVIKKAQKSV